MPAGSLCGVLEQETLSLLSTGSIQETEGKKTRIKKREVSHNFRCFWLVARIMNVK